MLFRCDVFLSDNNYDISYFDLWTDGDSEMFHGLKNVWEVWKLESAEKIRRYFGCGKVFVTAIACDKHDSYVRAMIMISAPDKDAAAKYIEDYCVRICNESEETNEKENLRIENLC